MIGAALAIVLAAPWSAPLSFRHVEGWRTGTSGTVSSIVLPSGTRRRLPGPESTAWISNVPYRDRATADPPVRTVTRLPRRGVVVWALIEPTYRAPKPGAPSSRLALARARHLRCCDGTPPPYTRVWELTGTGPDRVYRVIVRVYFGSRPKRAMLSSAQRALDALRQPPARP